MSEGIVLKKPRARIDLAACYTYIGERSPEAARRFRLAAEATFDALASAPGIGAPFEATAFLKLRIRSGATRRRGGSTAVLGRLARALRELL
jgi:plasmid stabilization system protein ParE